jgi:hypothetical protein
LIVPKAGLRAVNIEILTYRLSHFDFKAAIACRTSVELQTNKGRDTHNLFDNHQLTMAEAFDINQLQESLQLPFPVPTKQVAGIVNGIQTDVMVMGFSDKIMITISQKGRLAHWVSLGIPWHTTSTNGDSAACAP